MRLLRPPPGGSTATLKAHLRQAAKTLGRKPAQLREAEELALECRDQLYLWGYFCEIYRYGERLTFTELKHYAELKSIELTATEVEMLMALEKIALEDPADG